MNPGGIVLACLRKGFRTPKAKHGRLRPATWDRPDAPSRDTTYHARTGLPCPTAGKRDQLRLLAERVASLRGIAWEFWANKFERDDIDAWAVEREAFLAFGAGLHDFQFQDMPRAFILRNVQEIWKAWRYDPWVTRARGPRPYTVLATVIFPRSCCSVIPNAGRAFRLKAILGGALNDMRLPFIIDRRTALRLQSGVDELRELVISVHEFKDQKEVDAYCYRHRAQRAASTVWTQTFPAKQVSKKKPAVSVAPKLCRLDLRLHVASAGTHDVDTGCGEEASTPVALREPTVEGARVCAPAVFDGSGQRLAGPCIVYQGRDPAPPMERLRGAVARHQRACALRETLIRSALGVGGAWLSRRLPTLLGSLAERAALACYDKRRLCGLRAAFDAAL
jgi:hypothetical protein